MNALSALMFVALLILLLAQAAISTHEGPLPGWQ